MAGDLHRAHHERVRPAGAQADHERALIDAAESRQRLLRGAGRDLGPDVEQHEEMAQIAGEERHLVGAGDQDPVGVRDRLDRALHLGAADAPGGVLDVDVIGGDGLLEWRLIEAEPRRGRLGVFAVRWWWRYSSRAASCSSGKPSKPSAWLKRTTVEDDVRAPGELLGR